MRAGLQRGLAMNAETVSRTHTLFPITTLASGALKALLPNVHSA